MGTDVLVRALSEICIRPESQATHNALKMLNKAGSTLFLAESVLDEVYGHIHAADREFEHFYQPWERNITLLEAKQSDRILIRAYFYSKLEPDRHATRCATWGDFLGQFGDPNWFRRPEGKDSFAAYLQRKFAMKFIPTKDIQGSVPASKATALKQKIGLYKSDDRLAWNDAYLALYIDEKRRRDGEVMGDSMYGFRTWWLTEEFKVLESAREIGIKHNLNMHPQFLMNLYAASPGMNSLTKAFEGVFPTNFGLRITDRVSANTMKRFLAEAVKAANADEAISAARIRERANVMLGLQYSSTTLN